MVDLPPTAVEQVAGCSRNVAFAAGQLLLAEGDPADTLYLIRRGRVGIEVYAPGYGPVVIETVGPRGEVGWSWLFPPYRYHFDARAIEPVGAVAVDGICLRNKADAEPALGYALMKRVSGILLERLQATRVRLLDLYGSNRAG
jgi:CRP/FNR family transcriptional regulator, cyclic AMP receptor protein